MIRPLLCAGFIVLSGTVCAQVHFDSGSDGSDGALDVPFGQTVVLNMDDNPDGVFQFTDVTIAGTLAVEPNADNTPLVLLVQSDFMLTGTMSLNGAASTSTLPGAGGPGGFAGGNGVLFTSGTDPGPGLGPGGGAAIFTGDPTGTGAGRNTFMRPSLIPLIGGSGGGGGDAASFQGGGGGGAILIAVNGVFDMGGSAFINLTGGAGRGVITPDIGGGGGAGGAIRIIAGEVRGGWDVNVLGGAQGSGTTIPGRGDDGIIRIETFRLTRSFSNLRGRTYFSLPGLVFTDATDLATLRINKIGGVDVPPDAGANTAQPDVILPPGVSNPVTVEVTATNVTPGQTATIRINYSGEGGRVLEATTGALSGTNEQSTATAAINLDAGVGTIAAILSTPPAMRAGNAAPGLADMSLSLGGEPVTRIEQIAPLGGGKPEVAYVTASGKREVFPAP
ncbi:hypothetical protein HZA57_02355 [Candidatus Poribacteria bacterium]|nr:hypothetical protein [Candidatus Poribacteria bacterium]